MDKTGVNVSLIGRKSRCKLAFLRASSSSDNPIADTATQATSWWTPDFAPRQTDLVQAPVHGFSPSGERLLPAGLRSVSVADIVDEESITATNDSKPWASSTVLLLVSADVVFHRGQPRTTRAGGSNPVKAAVVHARERLGGGDKVKLAVAVSVDVEDDGAGKLVPSVIRCFLDEVRDDKELEGVPISVVSPRTELWLREQESEGGRVSYRRGDSSFRVRLNESCDVLRCFEVSWVDGAILMIASSLSRCTRIICAPCCQPRICNDIIPGV